MSNHTFVLTKKTANILNRLRREKIKCAKCGEPFQLGDKIVSQGRSNRVISYFHKDCWDFLFIEA